MKFNGKVKIVNKQQLQEDIFQLTVEKPSEIDVISPGHFFNLMATTSGSPLLRRPISVSNTTENSIEFTIKVLGKGTEWLSQKRIGDYLEIMGPLGNGFDVNDKMEKVLLLGGGIGVAPIKGLLAHLTNKNIKCDSIIGFRDQPIFVEEFKTFSEYNEIISEKDTNYKLGYVTEYFEKIVKSNNYDAIYACGPEAMLKSLVKVSEGMGLRLQLLMENKMACGIGACLVCTCKVKQGDFDYKHVRMCKEGPMFYSDEVIFDED
ncbi:dihydroorotate dehydrogenase electron transfer subunit [Fusibacter bizertensis]